MGNINNMRNVANSTNSMKSYVIHKNIKEKQNKPKLRITGVKDLVTLIGPNAKNHKLNDNQRRFQLASRVGLGIAGVAAAFSIANATIHSNANSISDNNSNISIENQTIDKNDAIDNAVNSLITIAYKDKLSYLNGLSDSDKPTFKITHDSRINSDTFVIYEKPHSPNENDREKFSYTKYNNPEHQSLNSKNPNNPQIAELIGFIIDVYNNPNPSIEDLNRLDQLASTIVLDSFVLHNNSIVAEADRDTGFEIDD